MVFSKRASVAQDGGLTWRRHGFEIVCAILHAIKRELALITSVLSWWSHMLWYEKLQSFRLPSTFRRGLPTLWYAKGGRPFLILLRAWK